MEKIRKRIDVVDQKILSLIAERLRLMDYSREEKLRNNLPIVDKERKKQVFNSRLELAKELKINEKFAKNLMSVILAGCECQLVGKDNTTFAKLKKLSPFNLIKKIPSVIRK